MKLGYLFSSVLLLACWVFLGNTANPFGTPVPALGTFFGPTTGFWANAAAVDDDRTDVWSLHVADERARGTVFFDRRGVAHLFASTLEEASFLQGYVHAADRLWQMDVSTRATEGRLSEILGRRTYERDLRQIRLGYRQSARCSLDTIQTNFREDYAALAAYSAGVNAYVAQLDREDYPVEYKLLNHEPIEWSPYRSILLMKGMSQALSGRYQDAAEARTRQLLDDKLFAELFPKHQADESPVVPTRSASVKKSGGTTPPPVLTEPGLTGTSFPTNPAPAAAPLTDDGLAAAALLDAEPDAFTLLPDHPGNGSNNWAVNARHSNTGYPMLANDPHLALTLPSIWHEIQIHLPDVNARGVGLPGAPGIMIGYNDFMAYGETNVGQDVTDWYAIEWTDENRTHYRVDGRELAAEMREETLRIKGAADETVIVPYTIFGPVSFSTGPYRDMAMRYLGHEVVGRTLRSHSTVGTFLQLMRARNYTDYENALRGHVDPAQNFIYADRYDEIAIRPNGFFPVRSSGDGGQPYPGNTRASQWRGYVPFAQRPVDRNPERGYVSSANQITTGPEYAYAYTGGFEEYRGRYINRALEREGVLNQRAMKELQLSSYSLQAEEITPLLLARLNRNQLTPAGRSIFRLVADWDYHYEGNSRAATFYENWRKRTYKLTFDELRGDTTAALLQPDLRVWTQLMRRSPQHPIFEIKATADFRENASTLVQRAFEELLDELEGQEPEEWSVARNSKVRHLGAIPGFGSGLITSGGGKSSPRVLIGGHGASWRMVVELGKHPRAWGSLPGGASGHPASEAYDNGLEDWSNGRYHDLTRWRDWEEAEVKSRGRWDFE